MNRKARKQNEALATDAGLTITNTTENGGHYWLHLTSPIWGTTKLRVGGTPSCGRALLNHRANIRRFANTGRI